MPVDLGLKTMHAGTFMSVVKVGSGDWSWAEEAADLIGRNPTKLAAMIRDLSARGMQEPVLVGDDGRLWDGHNRVVAASIAGVGVLYDTAREFDNPDDAIAWLFGEEPEDG